MFGNKNICEILLREGAYFNLRNNEGATANEIGIEFCGCFLFLSQMTNLLTS